MYTFVQPPRMAQISMPASAIMSANSLSTRDISTVTVSVAGKSLVFVPTVWDLPMLATTHRERAVQANILSVLSACPGSTKQSWGNMALCADRYAARHRDPIPVRQQITIGCCDGAKINGVRCERKSSNIESVDLCHHVVNRSKGSRLACRDWYLHSSSSIALSFLTLSRTA